MAKFDKDHKPGPAAKLPKSFAITRTIRAGRTVYGAGDEKKYAESKPSQADFDRLKEAGVIVTGKDAEAEA